MTRKQIKEWIDAWAILGLIPYSPTALALLDEVTK